MSMITQQTKFAGTSLAASRHVCAFFDRPEDEYGVTLPFVEEGLERKGLAFHIVDPTHRDSYARRLEQAGIPVSDLEKTGQFELHTWPETYLRRGEFDADATLAFIQELLENRRQRFPLVRVVGHMTLTNAPRKTRDDWLSYEARLNQLLTKTTDTIVCTYETSKCDARMVIDLLRTHPVVIIGGVSQSNPFFVPADEFLARQRDRLAARANAAYGPANRLRSVDPSDMKRNLELYEQVLAIASHDLRTPLVAVMMGAALLTRAPGMHAEGIHTATRILESAKRMRTIIDELLDLYGAHLSGGIVVNLEPMDAHKLCERIVKELQMAYPGRKISLRAEGHGSGRWDANRLEQVVSNLASNALQYGPDEAPVTIESRGDETEWMLSVHNLGKAISPDALPHLFEPYRRGPTRAGSGGIPHLGIGLFIVKRIVQAHRGTVAVTSRPGEGTRFVVRLPRE